MRLEHWVEQYARLTTAFGKPKNAEQSKIYFEALAALPDGVVTQAVTRVIVEGKHWPRVADIRERADSLWKSQTAPDEKCWRCGGNGFVDGPPQQHFGVERPYAYVQRCPACRPTTTSAPPPPREVPTEPETDPADTAAFLEALSQSKAKIFPEGVRQERRDVRMQQVGPDA